MHVMLCSVKTRTIGHKKFVFNLGGKKGKRNRKRKRKRKRKGKEKEKKKGKEKGREKKKKGEKARIKRHLHHPGVVIRAK